MDALEQPAAKGRLRDGTAPAVLPSPREGGEALLGEAGTDEQLVAAVRAGSEAAFVRLVERHDASLRRLARLYTTEGVADEVVQDTWIAVLRGLERFEGRASLRTWMTRILINTAVSRAERERRQVPLSALAESAVTSQSSVPSDRFQQVGDRYPGEWVSFPERWDEQPEARLLASEGVEVARRAIADLPPGQREVVTLRDVEGWSSQEVCEALRITPGNQRVLLHRGRSRVRAVLERSMRESTVQSGRHRRPAEPTSHPNLERYYDPTTDRASLDAHIGSCQACQAWLADIQDRLQRLTCAEFVELVTEYLDAAVDGRARRRIDTHLALCEGCRNYLDQMRATIATIGRTAERAGGGEPAAAVLAGLLGAFRVWPRTSRSRPATAQRA